MGTELLAALKESTNYLTWAVFSFVACFSVYKTRDYRVKNKVKTSRCSHFIFWFYILFFFFFGVINIVLVIYEFSNSSIPYPVTGAVGFVALLVVINAAIVVFGKLEGTTGKSEGKIPTANSLKESVIQILDTDKYPVTWLIQMDKDNVVFSRIINGDVDESYAPVNYDKANVYAASILNGLQPPKHLFQSDIQTD
ncbi:hypothetical protein Q4R28_02150 [Morganella morganii]